jgi:MoxR-like ATPase
VSDFWVMRYLWDREEQAAPLAALIGGVIEPHAGEPDAHPLAAPAERVDAEQLARRLDDLAREVQARKPTVAAAARAREQLADLADRAAWLPDDAARQHLVDRARDLLRSIG